MTTRYTPTADERRQLSHVFTYHPPQGDQIQRYAELREAGKTLAFYVAELCPPSRERDIAIERISEAIMHANAAIARHEFFTGLPHGDEPCVL